MAPTTPAWATVKPDDLDCEEVMVGLDPDPDPLLLDDENSGCEQKSASDWQVEHQSLGLLMARAPISVLKSLYDMVSSDRPKSGNAFKSPRVPLRKRKRRRKSSALEGNLSVVASVKSSKAKVLP